MAATRCAGAVRSPHEHDDEPLSCVIVELGRLVECTVNRAVAPHWLTVSQYLALESIAREPGVSCAQLVA
jgi:hypothetical protein